MVGSRTQPATFFVPAPESNMLDLLGTILELLPDFVIEFLFRQFFLGAQEIWNWSFSKLL